MNPRDESMRKTHPCVTCFEGGATRQGMWVVSRSWERRQRQQMDSLPEPPREPTHQHRDFHPVRPFSNFEPLDPQGNTFLLL